MSATEKSIEFRKKLIEFAIDIIKLTKSLPLTPENVIFINQIIRSATSIGANYSEAMFALTKLDFSHCLNICKKETNETLYWLEIIVRFNPKEKAKIQELQNRGNVFLKIFISSVKTSQRK